MLALLRAVALRDAASVAATGAELFASGYKFDEPRHMSLTLMATAASQVATNQPEAALKLIGKNAARTSQTPPQALALHWVSAIAAAELTGDPARASLAKAR